ncbi:hypothetical protein C5960_18115 [Cronobacter sakazakii]|nr:hypothetical protein [Cronobacter sakazakii]ELY2486359.1 hypothetical protein [Cronobacter sakazakii]ELY2764497.1 hypothetical protein [Cronobacter sakazakii]ELY3977596.1 hypothetical protein [Cronobacter sakazakii]ELY3990280.1 hypothetical protein [Cronobacter sakazakii]PQZ04639.1 hypothetical protein C5960_18115 [Cronobacter sakazakii]
MLVDNNNIKPAPGSGPGWWAHLLSPAKEIMVFDKTVSLSKPFAIKAGDPVGHMGYFQAPTEGGYEARYQVHIECTSMDDNLEKFLTNPEKVGEKNPLWLKYAPGLALYTKDVAKGTFAKGTTSTTRTGILPLSKVTTETGNPQSRSTGNFCQKMPTYPKGRRSRSFYHSMIWQSWVSERKLSSQPVLITWMEKTSLSGFSAVLLTHSARRRPVIPAQAMRW